MESVVYLENREIMKVRGEKEKSLKPALFRLRLSLHISLKKNKNLMKPKIFTSIKVYLYTK